MPQSYFAKISDLARAIGVSETAVIAAQRILGYHRFGNNVWFTHGLKTDFIEEAHLAHKTEQAAARRKKSAFSAATNPPSDHATR